MVGAQGQVKWAKVAQQSSTYGVTHKKPPSRKQTIFFRVQTRRLAASFELLTGSAALTGPEKFPNKPHAIQLFWHENSQFQPDAKVLNA